jgi:hypothetical protein
VAERPGEASRARRESVVGICIVARGFGKGGKGSGENEVVGYEILEYR